MKYHIKNERSIFFWGAKPPGGASLMVKDPPARGRSEDGALWLPRKALTVLKEQSVSQKNHRGKKTTVPPRLSNALNGLKRAKREFSVRKGAEDKKSFKLFFLVFSVT
jgi:hypothetical protein